MMLAFALWPTEDQWALASEQESSTDKVVSESTAKDDAEILSEIKNHNDLMKNLEYLTDTIGPRLTGSQSLDQASHWGKNMFASYGLAEAHLEPWEIAHSWTRGSARGRIVSPTVQALTVVSAGWSPGTPGVVRGRVVYVKAGEIEDLYKYRGKLNGAIVITSKPTRYVVPQNTPLVPFGDFAVPVPVPVEDEWANLSEQAVDRFVSDRTEFLKAEHVAAVLVSSDKEYGLLNMRAVGQDFEGGQVPTAFVTLENYRLLWRLMQKGSVDVELEITNSFSDSPVTVFNTVAEIRGSSRPDETVVLAAHLDSWDLGEGATDNGTGSMVVLEAARALQKLGLRPQRTIRFILFTGEEQGENGSRHYVERHKNELSKISGVLVHDSGTGRVLSIMLMGNYQDRAVLDRLVAPLHGLGLLELSLREWGGTDHVPFADAGIPAFVAIQDALDYGRTHHSQADTFDRVVLEDLTQSAQVLAVWAYNVAQLPGMLPRKSGAEAVSGIWCHVRDSNGSCW